MLGITVLGFFASLQVAAGWVQVPVVAECPAVPEPAVVIESVTIANSQLGSNVDITATVKSSAPLKSNPILEISVSRPDGTELPCVNAVMPCVLRLCDGTTAWEIGLNREWNNQCPTPIGTYNAYMSVYLPDHPLAKLYFQDGNIVISLSVKDNGQVVGCASYPVFVKV